MKKKVIHYILALMATTGTSTLAIANNVKVTAVSKITNGGNITDATFTLSWDNSWRGGPANNYDAVWIFIKYKDASGDWKHADLSGTSSATNTDLTIEIPSDNKGVFIYRKTDGSGNITASAITLGILPIPENADLKVFGIEMVYVPQGSFYLGVVTHPTTPTFVSNYSNGGYTTTTSATPYPVPAGIPTFGNASGQLYDPLASFSSIPLDPNFPTGYKAFYCMKYELSQGGYRDFLNTISINNNALDSVFIRRTDLFAGAYSTLGTPVFGKTPNTNRNGLKTTGTGPDYIGCDANNNNIFNEADDGEWTACNFLRWNDMTAYLDWAALRPMTEMEYEKAAKGPIFPTDSMFASGTYADVVSSIITNPYTTSESVTPGLNTNTINYNSLNADGPLRNGFATDANSDRAQSGGSYYGIMELSGNLIENTVGTSYDNGRNFQGTLGDGQLTSNGEANQNSWPSGNGGGFERGGSFYESKSFSEASYRTPYLRGIVIVIGEVNLVHNGFKEFGCRGVRQQL